jgi:hypothetical protein
MPPVKSALLAMPFCGEREMAWAERCRARTTRDAERIDYLFWSQEGHAGNREAMQAYLRWETELPEQIAAEGLAGFTLGPH